MRPTHRSKLLIPGTSLDDLALLHCEWTLGLDRFAALRDARLVAGVPPDARPADLLGEHGDRWLFRFSLPTEHGTRTSAVRLTAVGQDVLVEHLVVDESQRSEPSADSPETTPALLELPDKRLAGRVVHGGQDDRGLALRFQYVLDERWYVALAEHERPDTAQHHRAQRCAQIYYDVLGDGRQLAWVGEHRPTVSENT